MDRSKLAAFFVYNMMEQAPLNELAWSVEDVNWEDHTVNWSDCHLIVVRSTWNYQAKVVLFRECR